MKKANILTIDDAKVMRTVIKRKLEEAGHTVTAVSGGREALKLKLKRATEELERLAGTRTNSAP